MAAFTDQTSFLLGRMNFPASVSATKRPRFGTVLPNRGRSARIERASLMAAI
jgi:hypothetical protein